MMYADDQSEITKNDEIKKLDDLYRKGKDADKREFSLMRSSLLLIGGEHYNKSGASRLWDRIRTTQQFSQETRLRLTKNHIGRIVNIYSNHVISAAPGVSIAPKHERDIRSRKSAELHEAVWQDGKYKNEFDELIAELADDFTGIGEVWTKTWYDDSMGKILGYEPSLDEMGQPVMDPRTGEQVPDESKPVREGTVKIEGLYGFNVIRDQAVKNVKKSPWYCLEKMVNTKELQKRFPKFADKIADSQDDTTVVFDAATGYRGSETGETLLKEWYFKPCMEYPEGKFYIQASGHVMDSGDLPGGIFPINCERFDSLQTRARGFSITERLRPYQIEINRTASAMAEHQVTLGADKLILQNGAKMSAGAKVPGIRAVHVTGAAPTILPGRSGSQYMEYMVSQTEEMYRVSEIDEDDPASAQLDPTTLLYRAASQKKKFKRYIKRFEGFLKRQCTTYLKMAKFYLDENSVIMAIGQNERINISEFKNDDSSLVDIKVEAQADDIETKLGRQISINHVLQYVGPQMNEESIGKLIKNMPYANLDESFSDFTLDYESATNDLLMLQRGEMAGMPIDNYEYYVKKVNSRMKQPDFRFLEPQIQELFVAYKDQLLGLMNEAKEAEVRATSGFIPDGGALVRADYYITTTGAEGQAKTARAEFPAASLEWLHQKLLDQGAFKGRMNDAVSEKDMIEMYGAGQGELPGAPTQGQAELPMSSEDELAMMLESVGPQGMPQG
jgi:hypothetical protein